MDEKENGVIAENTEKEETQDALESFLSRENEPIDKTTKGKVKSRKWLIIAAAAVVILVGVLLLVKLMPASVEEEETAQPAQITVSVSDKGEHQASVITEEKAGKIVPVQNGSGTLVSYDVADIKQIDVENESGSFTVLSETPVTTDENGEEQTEQTIYTLVGYEDFDLQTGQADAVANDASVVGFSSIANTEGEIEDYGLDHPRATVKIRYSDDTTSTVRVGNDAVSELGVYIAFGDSDTVYLAASESVDSFLFSVLDLVSLEITPTSEEVDTAMPLKAKISGTHYRKDIVLEQNDDEALNSSYLVTEPVSMPADAVESADIMGAIRGLYAEEVVCVNPSDSQLEGYGLKKPYATVEAEFTDMTIKLSASAPSDTGSVYVINHDKSVVYSIDLGAVEWANTSVNKLTPETVIDVKKEAVGSITVDGGKSYTFILETKTENVENDEGESEEVTTTTAAYEGEEMDTDNFLVFFQNLNGIKLKPVDDEKYDGDKVTIRLTYTTGRDDDVITLTYGGGNTMLANVNGTDMGVVYKNYINKLIDSVEDLIDGKDLANL